MKQLKNGMKESSSLEMTIQTNHSPNMAIQTNNSAGINAGSMTPEMKKEAELQDIQKNRHGIFKNSTCCELLFGNICYYISGQIIIVAFVYNGAKIEVSLGFFIGVLLSAAMVIHMTVSLEQAMCMGEREAYNHVRKTTAIRLAVLFILFIIIGITDICNILAALAGVMALKVSAYLQPFTHKVLAEKSTGKGR